MLPVMKQDSRKWNQFKHIIEPGAGRNVLGGSTPQFALRRTTHLVCWETTRWPTASTIGQSTLQVCERKQAGCRRRPLDVSRKPVRPNISASFVKPPGRKYCFRRRFCCTAWCTIADGSYHNWLPRGEQPTTELSIFVRISLPGVGPKSVLKPPYFARTAFRKAMFVPKGVSASRPASRPRSKTASGAKPRCPASGSHRGGVQFPHRKDASPATSPLSLEQRGRKVLQPHWFNCYVVVHECDYVALGFRNPTVRSVRFPRRDSNR